MAVGTRPAPGGPNVPTAGSLQPAGPARTGWSPTRPWRC